VKAQETNSVVEVVCFGKTLVLMQKVILA